MEGRKKLLAGVLVGLIGSVMRNTSTMVYTCRSISGIGSPEVDARYLATDICYAIERSAMHAGALMQAKAKNNIVKNEEG